MEFRLRAIIGASLSVFVAIGCLSLAARALPFGQAVQEEDFELEINPSIEQSFMQDAANKEVEKHLQGVFEDKVDEMIRLQDDLERSVAVKSQNLESKKKLSKEEKKALLDSYRDMPKTLEEYNKISKDIKRTERKTPQAKVVQDDKLVTVPEPRYIIKRYNDPPGTKNIDLRNLKTLRQVRSEGVVSPQKDRLAYTTVYYSGYNDKVSSEVFFIDLDTQKPLKARIKNASVMNKEEVKLIDTGLKEEYPTLFKSLTILDWSKDGKKIAIKERIGSSHFGIWQTNLWVYDLAEQKAKQLVEVREAVKYWWKLEKNINIDDYRWDIVPLGWDAQNPDRLFVSAYAYTNKKSLKLLGNFSIDVEGKQTQVVSFEPCELSVEPNGLVLTGIKD